MGAKLRSAVGGVVGPHAQKTILDQLKDDLRAIGYQRAAELIGDGTSFQQKDMGNSNGLFSSWKNKLRAWMTGWLLH